MAYAGTGYYAIGTGNITGVEKFDHLIIDDRDRRIRGPGKWLMYFSRKDKRGRWQTVLTVGRRLTKEVYVLGRVVGGFRDLMGDA
ncbi:MAG: hypothetical protein COB49_00510 [Alphaproteobacteria bacterium]|nr:MAG: hypothetical protein COB49_00510 [Alphaproteobacteria bacterium]